MKTLLTMLADAQRTLTAYARPRKRILFVAGISLSMAFFVSGSKAQETIGEATSGGPVAVAPDGGAAPAGQFVAPWVDVPPTMPYVDGLPVVQEPPRPALPYGGTRYSRRVRQSIEFTIDFRNPDGTPHAFGGYRSTGAFVLAGNRLHYELSLVGLFSSAEIRGSALSRARAKTVLDLGPPHIAIHPPCSPLEPCEPDFTAFFGEGMLSRSQVKHLMSGGYYVSVDDGAVLGRILPAE